MDPTTRPPATVDPPRRPSALVAFLGAFALLKLALVAWASGRGFEIGDEGAILLILDGPAGAPAGYEFYRLLSLLPDPSALGLHGARLVRIGVEVFAWLVLARAVGPWLGASAIGPGSAGAGFVVAFAALGTLLGGGTRGLSYNDLTTACASVTLAGLLVLWTPRGTRDPMGPSAPGSGSPWPALVAMSVASGVGVLVKFPSGLALTALVAAHLALFPAPRARGARWRSALAYLLGAAAVACAGVLAASPGTDLLAARLEEARLYKGLLGYDVVGILARYLHHDRSSHAVTLAALAAFAALRAPVARTGVASSAGWTLPVAAGLAVSVAGGLLLHPPYVHPAEVACWSVVVLLVLALGWIATRSDGSAGAGDAPGDDRALAPRRRADLALVALLAVSPLLAMAGTNVALTLRLGAHLLPVFLAIAVLLGQARRASGTRGLREVVLVVLLPLAATLTWWHQWRRPYGLPAPMPAQVLRVPGRVDVLVDRATASFLGELASAADRAGWTPGQRMVALDYMPGLVWFLGGVSPGTPLYSLHSPAFNCAFLQRDEASTPPWLLLARPPGPEMEGCFGTHRFPDDFREAGRFENPWRYAYAWFHDAPLMPELRLYAPRDPRAAEGVSVPR